jgi:hypothetical protein
MRLVLFTDEQRLSASPGILVGDGVVDVSQRSEFEQFVSLDFGKQARAAGIAQSMGSKGDCYDTQSRLSDSVVAWMA